MLEKNNKKLINAWTSFDWANSVYNLKVTTATFPIYYLTTIQDVYDGKMVQFFNFTIKNSVLYSLVISFSFLIIVFISPILSGIADYGGLKKQFMLFFTYLGSLSCIGLHFLREKMWNMALPVLFWTVWVMQVPWFFTLFFYQRYLPMNLWIK